MSEINWSLIPVQGGMANTPNESIVLHTFSLEKNWRNICVGTLKVLENSTNRLIRVIKTVYCTT